MSHTKRIYNRIQIFRNWCIGTGKADPKQKYRQLCMGNCRNCKPGKIKEHRKKVQYLNEYYTEQIKAILI
jgi:hypothetical protein